MAVPWKIKKPSNKVEESELKRWGGGFWGHVKDFALSPPDCGPPRDVAEVGGK